jgi:hypothetical protein
VCVPLTGLWQATSLTPSSSPAPLTHTLTAADAQLADACGHVIDCCITTSSSRRCRCSCPSWWGWGGSSSATARAVVPCGR